MSHRCVYKYISKIYQRIATPIQNIEKFPSLWKVSFHILVNKFVIVIFNEEIPNWTMYNNNITSEVD